MPRAATIKPAAQTREAADARATFAADMLAYFYPVHYRFGMEMERAMSQGRVDRKQAAMLWLVHARGQGDGWVRRKEVEAELFNWFDLSKSKISRLLGDLSRGEMRLIETVEAPDSAREKLLRLTAEGKVFIAGMIAAASDIVERRFAGIPLEDQRAGLKFLARAFLAE
jgi:DNA-binding MarR family transcriptional regulator